MKKFVLASALAFAIAAPAFAADLPPPSAPPPRAPAVYAPIPAPIFTWTGIYVGLNGGYNFGTVAPNAAGASNLSTTGFLIGGTIGGNYQIGQFVIGLEGDGDYNSVNNSFTTTNTVTGVTSTGTFKSNWLATVRGRAGYAWDRLLIFGTGGAAFAPASLSGTNLTTGAAFSGNSTLTGWTAGGGLEYAFTPNITAKAEYLYISFPSSSLGIAGGSGFNFTDNVIRAGINYKFW
jgi:outer membrane immunogenic protein